LGRAVSASQDLLSNYQNVIEALTLATGSKGVYDVSVDGALIYSKAETGRHAEPGEVLERFTDLVDDIRRYGE
jgi:selT/selW/selH-like putative selenoprotein